MSTIGEGFSGNYADPDPFQTEWNDPEKLKGALYVHQRFLVRPDDRPVAPHHVMVVAREFQPVESLTFAHQQAMWALAMVTFAHMTRQLSPNRKVAIAMWGNQVRTGHLHLVPRNQPTDATQWKPMEFQPTDTQGAEEVKAAQLAETRRLLNFPPDLAAQTDALIDATLAANANVQVPDGLMMPQLPLPGERPA